MRAFGVGPAGRRSPTRGVYLLRADDAATATDPARNAALARRIGTGGDVEFAEPNMVGGPLADFGFHAWPDGPPTAVAGGAAAWTGQAAGAALRLTAAQALSRGSGVQVAVIDTGVAAGHPVFAGRVRSGWDFVDDEGDTDDHRTGVDRAAAGNYGDADETYPAARPGVLSVGALAAPDAAQLAAFSSRDGWVKVAAPGVGIVGPMPGGFSRWSGTSMAAPFVAGQAALLWAANPRRAPAAVTSAITRTTDRLARGAVAFGAVDPVASLRPTCWVRCS